MNNLLPSTIEYHEKYDLKVNHSYHTRGGYIIIIHLLISVLTLIDTKEKIILNFK